MTTNWRDPFARLEADPDLLADIASSDDPAAQRFSDWLCKDLMPALDPFGFRGPPGAGQYEWPGSQTEFEEMIAAAVNAVRPVQ